MNKYRVTYREYSMYNISVTLTKSMTCDALTPQEAVDKVINTVHRQSKMERPQVEAISVKELSKIN